MMSIATLLCLFLLLWAAYESHHNGLITTELARRDVTIRTLRKGYDDLAARLARSQGSYDVHNQTPVSGAMPAPSGCGGLPHARGAGELGEERSVERPCCWGCQPRVAAGLSRTSWRMGATLGSAPCALCGTETSWVFAVVGGAE